MKITFDRILEVAKQRFDFIAKTGSMSPVVPWLSYNSLANCFSLSLSSLSNEVDEFEKEGKIVKDYQFDGKVSTTFFEDGTTFKANIPII